MVGAVNGLENNYNFFQAPQVKERGANPVYGGENFFVNPGTEITGFTNGLGISIPENHSYTTDVDGTRVSMGLDGVGLAHRNPSEYTLHLIG